MVSYLLLLKPSSGSLLKGKNKRAEHEIVFGLMHNKETFILDCLV